MLRIAVRVDASIEMGMGHLTRCITLANALSAEGASVSFLMRDHAAAFGRLVESAGHQLCLLPATGRGADPSADPPLAHAHWLPISWREDAVQTSEAIGRLGAVDWLVVDHYALDARWERDCAAARLAFSQSTTLPTVLTMPTSCLIRICRWRWRPVIAACCRRIAGCCLVRAMRCFVPSSRKRASACHRGAARFAVS